VRTAVRRPTVAERRDLNDLLSPSPVDVADEFIERVRLDDELAHLRRFLTVEVASTS
jgi:hypothetical protein